jgi:hypothetical protein
VIFHQINVPFRQKRAFCTISKVEKSNIVVILARLRSEVRYQKSEKAALVAVTVVVFAVIKKQWATALFPVWLLIAHFPIP